MKWYNSASASEIKLMSLFGRLLIPLLFREIRTRKMDYDSE